MRLLFIIGIDTIGSYFSHYNKNAYLKAGWSAIIVRKTATRCAAILSGFVSGGVSLYNEPRQRNYDASQAEKQRAYANYTSARNNYDNSYFKRGSKPIWSEDNYKAWSNPK